MADCVVLDTCEFFNDALANMPSTSNIFKIVYCTGDSADCARLIVRNQLGKEKVPSDLYPNHSERAREIIDNG